MKGERSSASEDDAVPLAGKKAQAAAATKLKDVQSPLVRSGTTVSLWGKRREEGEGWHHLVSL